jgi:hypothetical protein
MGMQVSSCQSQSGLVQTYIGTAYDTVKFVADNLGAIEEISENVEYYNDTYYGPLDDVPTTRPDGTPIESGDMYFNTGLSNMFVYNGTAWAGLGATAVITEVVFVTSEMLQGDDTVVPLQNSYTPNHNTITVFVNSVYQYSQFTDPTGAYVETDANTLTFPNVTLEIGEPVNVITGFSVDTLNPRIAVSRTRYVTVLPDARIISIPNDYLYEPGSGDLQVYIEGHYGTVQVDYYESSPSTITLTGDYPTGTEINFVIGHLISNIPSFDADVISLNIASDFYINRNILDISKSIYLKGYALITDGGGGAFSWNPTVSKVTANGASFIDPTVPMNAQGTGIGEGAWERQYNEDMDPRWLGFVDRSMTAFRNLTPVDDDAFTISGFYLDNPLGGGTFYWDSTIAKEEHNGGTIISPNVVADPGTSSWYTAPVTGPDGCWTRREDAKLSVTWFGSVEDGATDDFLAFEAAGAIGTTEVPEGTYEISGAVTGSFYSFGAVTINTGSVTTIKNLMV